MALSRADVRNAELLQNLPERALVINDAEAFFYDTAQVDPAPVRHAVLRSIWSGFDDFAERGQLLAQEPWRGALRAEVLQPIRALGVEAVNPVAQRLTIHPADLRRVFADHPIQNCRQRPQESLRVNY